MNLQVLQYSLIKVAKTTSTNALLKEMKSTQALDNGTVLLGYHQTHGKGQKGNTWSVKPGLNLTFSVYTEPKIDAQKAFYLNIISALAVHKTLADLNIKAEIKWPNDILVNGKKIAGILVENQLQGQTINYSIIGIGLNLNQKKFGTLTNATSTVLEKDLKLDREDVLRQIHGYLDFYMNHLNQSNTQLLKKLYLKHLYQIYANHNYKDESGAFVGNIQGIAENGQLSVKKENDKIVHYDIQEISYL